LFHIGEFWMQVPSKTLFNRWLSQGRRRTVIIRLMSDASRYADAQNVRVLTGTLMHQTAPRSGRLPAGDSAFVHVLFLKDDRTGTLGAVTFQTSDLAIAAKFDAFDDAPVSIVIEIK
jgi:hypothetical protein